MAPRGHQLPLGLIAYSSPPVTVIPRDRSVLRIGVYPRAYSMRSALALGLLITLCYSADAATVHHLRTHHHHHVTSGFADSFGYERLDRRSTTMHRKRDPQRPRMVARPCCLTLTTRTARTLALRITIRPAESGKALRRSRFSHCSGAANRHSKTCPSCRFIPTTRRRRAFCGTCALDRS